MTTLERKGIWAATEDPRVLPEVADVKALPDYVLPKYSSKIAGLAQPRTAFRKLCPFAMTGLVGPTAMGLRVGFLTFPQLVRQWFETLDSFDTAEEPRRQLRDSMEAMLDGSIRQIDIRKEFEKSADMCKMEMTGRYSSVKFHKSRLNYDAGYRLRVLTLQMVSTYFNRYLEIGSQPGQDAGNSCRFHYLGDVQKDMVLKSAADVCTHWDNRVNLSAEYNELFADLMMIERDIFGTWRSKKYGDGPFVFHCLGWKDLGRTAHHLDLLHIPVVRQYLHYKREEYEIHKDRWMKLTFTPMAEDHRAWWGHNDVQWQIEHPEQWKIQQEKNEKQLKEDQLPGNKKKAPVQQKRGLGADMSTLKDGGAMAELPSQTIKLALPNDQSALYDYNLPLSFSPSSKYAYNYFDGDPIKFDMPIIRKPRGLIAKWLDRGLFSCC